MTIEQIQEIFMEDFKCNLKEGITKKQYTYYTIDFMETLGKKNLFWDMDGYSFANEAEVDGGIIEDECYLNLEEAESRLNEFYRETDLEQSDKTYHILKAKGYQLVKTIYEIELIDNDIEGGNIDYETLEESKFKFEICDSQDNVISTVSNPDKAYDIYLDDRYNYHIECCGIVLVESEPKPVDQDEED